MEKAPGLEVKAERRRLKRHHLRPSPRENCASERGVWVHCLSASVRARVCVLTSNLVGLMTARLGLTVLVGVVLNQTAKDDRRVVDLDKVELAPARRHVLESVLPQASRVGTH